MTLTQAESNEAAYNCRDVLSMCRTYPHLVAALERTNTLDVYEVDEQMADLALQMSKIGMPVNSELRQQIGDRLRKLRDEAVTTLRLYTEGEYAERFLDWFAAFFARTVRKGEPAAGSLRVGPAQAQVDLGGVLEDRRNWREYKKACAATPDVTPEISAAEVEAQLDEIDEHVLAAKQAVKVAVFEDDAYNGLVHTAESAFEIRKAIRKAEAQETIAKEGVNFGAKVQQCAILRAAGVPLVKTTSKSGLPQIDKEVLGALKRHQAAKALLRYILVDKTINVYIEGEEREGTGSGKTRPVMVTEDGYIHPLWSVHRITGRWSSSPNVQNISVRAGGGEENLRAMIEAPEGYTFVGADFAQLEARLIGAMSRCSYLLDVFKKGEDVHGAFAAIGFPGSWPRLAATFVAHKAALAEGDKCKCPTCAERNRTRDIVKRLEYGGFYGGLEQTLWESAVADFPEFTLHQTRAFLAEFNRRLPEVLVWRQKTLDEAYHDGEIRSPILGRRQVFPLGRVEPPVAYNYKAQAGGADLWDLGAIEFCGLWDQEEFNARIIHNGHDSVLIMCRIDLAPQIEQDVRTCWDREWNDVQFFMETKIANSWSET